MNKKNKIQILVNAITRLATSGFPLDAAAVHYIDTLFSCPGPADLRRILLEQDDADAETLYDLIFFPGVEMQVQLEPALEAHEFDEADVAAVIHGLQRQRLQALIRFPDSRGALTVPVPDETIGRLVRRLRLTVSLDGRIIGVLQSLSPPDRCWIRVMLRNCRIAFVEPFVRVLCRCVETMAAASPHFRPAFALLVDFLETADPARDIYAGLLRKKHLLTHQIVQAEKDALLLEKASVEALMLAGRRFSAIDMGTARKQIALMDHLCLSVFGKTDLFEY